MRLERLEHLARPGQVAEPAAERVVEDHAREARAARLRERLDVAVDLQLGVELGLGERAAGRAHLQRARASSEPRRAPAAPRRSGPRRPDRTGTPSGRPRARRPCRRRARRPSGRRAPPPRRARSAARRRRTGSRPVTRRVPRQQLEAVQERERGVAQPPSCSASHASMSGAILPGEQQVEARRRRRSAAARRAGRPRPSWPSAGRTARARGGRRRRAARHCARAGGSLGASSQSGGRCRWGPSARRARVQRGDLLDLVLGVGEHERARPRSAVEDRPAADREDGGVEVVAADQRDQRHAEPGGEDRAAMIGREPPNATTWVYGLAGSASSVLHARLSACAGSSSIGHAR